MLEVDDWTVVVVPPMPDDRTVDEMLDEYLDE